MPLQPTGRMPGTPNAIITSPMIVSAPNPPAAAAAAQAAMAAAAAGGNLQFPVAAPRSSRSAAAAAVAAGAVPRSKAAMGVAGGIRHGSPAKMLQPGQRMPFYPNLSGSETDISTSTENLTQVRSKTRTWHLLIGFL